MGPDADLIQLFLSRHSGNIRFFISGMDHVLYGRHADHEKLIQI